MITQTELKRRLHYNLTTGIFTWRVKPCRRIHKGAIAGGGKHIMLDRKLYKPALLAILYVTGEYKKNIKHKDGNIKNNAYRNLYQDNFATRATIYGIGINDSSTSVAWTENGKLKFCHFYTTWTSMFQRCYSEQLHARLPSYKEAEVCPEWHLFSNFKKWMQSQDYENNVLDKDLLQINKKLYSPETCVFITHALNTFLGFNKKKKTKNPLGVNYNGKTFAYKMKFNGKFIYKGKFKTAKDASIGYQKQRVIHIRILASEAIDPRVSAGLYALADRYAVS